MGCDILAFLEYKNYHLPRISYSAIFGCEQFLTRNYELFACIAGVRRRNEIEPLFPARGFPEDVSEIVFRRFYQTVVTESEEADFTDENVVKLSEALKRCEQPIKISEGFGSWHETGFLPYPEWHDPSYLTLAELKAAFSHSGIIIQNLDPSYRLLIDTMTLAEEYLKAEVRLVFWFDS